MTSKTKSKVVPHNKESHDSRPHSRKSHRDQSSLRLRGSGSRKHKSRRDEELGGEDKSGFLDYIVEDDWANESTNETEDRKWFASTALWKPTVQ